MDPGLRGFWTLNVEQSSFGSVDAKPKSGLVNWSENGFVFSVVNGDGSLYADAVVLDTHCKMIGVPASYSCDFKVVTPHHTQLTIRDGSSVRRVADIELISDNTTRTVHHVTPASGKPYDETTIWERQR